MSEPLKHLPGLPVERALKVISGRWKAVILYHLFGAPCRLSDLGRLIPDVSQKVLIEQLREMEAHGLVRRAAATNAASRIDYLATPLAESLRPVLLALCDWGRQHATALDERDRLTACERVSLPAEIGDAHPSITHITGGCQCGAIRYVFDGIPGPASFCHCRMCQKAGGNVGLALARLDATEVTWTRERPAEFRSSPVVARGFCARCGTPLYMKEDGDPCYEMTIGTFDTPNMIPPTAQVGVDSRLDWFDTLHVLPGHRTDEDRAPTELAKLVSLQHPDRDDGAAST